MYTEYYGLSARPFQLSPKPAVFYAGRAHRRAVAYLTFGLQQGEGFVVITGEAGAGKTTLVAYLEEQLSHQRLLVARLDAVSMEAQDVLKLVARSVELAPQRALAASLLGSIEHDLRQRRHRRQRVLLVVDEAQNLTLPALDALRILSNFTENGRALIQILLLGHPQFRDTLACDGLERLRQRVVASAHLGPLEPDEIQPYIEHRLRRVGWNERPALEPAVFGEIHDYSRGLPRRINLLAARLLVHGTIEQAEVLAAADTRELALELEREHASPLPGAPAPGVHPPPCRNPILVRGPGGHEDDEGRNDVERLWLKLETVYEDLTRERDRTDGTREEAERLRNELHGIDVERLRVDAEITRRLAEILAAADALRPNTPLREGRY